MQEDPFLNLYFNRIGHLLHVILGSLLLTECVTLLLGGVKLLPGQEILGFVALFGGGGILLHSLYYVVTPIPRLRLDNMGFSYQRFPLVVRRIRWEDMEDISAIRDEEKRRGKSNHLPRLMVKIAIKPEAVAAYKGRHEFSYMLPFTDLFVSPKNIVEYIRRFHTVNYQDLYA